MTQTVQPYAAGAMDREMNEYMADAAEATTPWPHRQCIARKLLCRGTWDPLGPHLVPTWAPTFRDFLFGICVEFAERSR